MAKAKVSHRSLDELFEVFEAKPEKYIRTNVLPVDLLTDGQGLPCSGFWHLWSPNGMGKSTMMLSVAKELAKRDRKTLYVSVEPSNKLFADMGLDDEPYCDLIRQISPVTYNECQEVMSGFFESDIDFCVIDSISALSTTSMFEGSSDKTIEDHLVAPDAMPRLRLIKWLHATMRRSNDKAVFLLFHASGNFNAGWGNFDPYVPESGQKPQQFSVASSTLDGGCVIYSPEDPKQVFGRDLYLKSPHKNRFSRLGGVRKGGIPIRIIFGKGVGNTYTLMHYCVWRGIMKLGSWSTCSWNGVDDRVQGKVGRLNWVKEHYNELVEDFYSNASEYVAALAANFDAGDV